MDYKEYNLSTFYMLPLLELSPNIFNSKTDNNLINVYITTSANIVVYVKDKKKVLYKYYEDINYLYDIDEEEDNSSTMIVYKVPDRFEDDFLYFTKGMYTKMSMFAKDNIKKYSGLNYNTPNGRFMDEEGKIRSEKDYNQYIRTGQGSVITPTTISTECIVALDRGTKHWMRMKRDIEDRLDVRLNDDVELLEKVREREYVKL